MAIPTVVVNYNGTNVGRIYLDDIGQRNQLGGGKGLYTLGQDQYISYGSDATLVGTSDVYLSATSGRLKKYSDAGVLTVTA